jgi:hypothetical protein
MSAYLKNFQDSELIFDEQETRQILIFFFPDDKSTIDNATINNNIRNFAQGLLVEAVDASYAMGYIEALFKSVCRFKGPADFTKTFAKKAMRHWFEHATQQDLMRVKIYESVRSPLTRNFRSEFLMKINGIAKVKGRSTYAALKPQNYAKSSHEILWG